MEFVRTIHRHTVTCCRQQTRATPVYADMATDNAGSSCMEAVLLTGHGGYDCLEYRTDVPIPVPAADEVLIRVEAAGINNTDINTRLGWYSSSVTSATSDVAVTDEHHANTATADKGIDEVVAGDWTGAGLHFPRIQGADVCGMVTALGEGAPRALLGQRVIVQSCLLSLAEDNFTPFLGSERDGAFAQYVTAPVGDTYVVTQCNLSAAQLAAVPCAYGTAENLLHRALVTNGERVLITGASGNVGLALVQLAQRRGALVTAVASRAKHDVLQGLGAHECLETGKSFIDDAGGLKAAFDVVIDVVGGPQWSELLEVLKPGGRYACAGAIAGPMVELDLRKLYLKDLTLYGCTSQSPDVFPAIIGYLERGEIAPLVSMTFDLKDIVRAQQEFLSKKQIGKIVMIPASANS
jgi:NADPH:quinone reductase-like Zn-dependent oxidoreductase